MATLIDLPETVQSHISNFLRPRWRLGPTTFSGIFQAPDVASIKAVHPNLGAVPLWKKNEWKKRIREWGSENLTKMRYKYQYGTLPDQMIKKGWEEKINTTYRHQNCYVEHKFIYFEVSLKDLISGIHPLPSAFGRDSQQEDDLADLGSLQLSVNGGYVHEMVPAPTLNTMIPKNKRREWLIKCFIECVLEHYTKKMAVQAADKQPDFMKEFKKIMDLPFDYPFTQTNLFKIFLIELNVYSGTVYSHEAHSFDMADNINDLCSKELNILV